MKRSPLTQNRARECEHRFWPKVRKTPSCWEWIASLNTHGYGQFACMEHKNTLCGAHIFSWVLHNGDMPENKSEHLGWQVCHTCDNPSCVNPAHLFLGTSGDNARDMARKGRATKHGTVYGGENNPNAKLDTISAALVFLAARDGYGSRELAREFGVTKTQISWIRDGKSWPALHRALA